MLRIKSLGVTKMRMVNKMNSKYKRSYVRLMAGISILLFPILSFTPSITHSEVLQIPETPKSFSVTLPGRGMSMTEVLEKFGEPLTKEPEVGEPPITRWNYENYRVIFEYQYVIHSLSTNNPIGFQKPVEDEVAPESSEESTPQ